LLVGNGVSLMQPPAFKYPRVSSRLSRLFDKAIIFERKVTRVAVLEPCLAMGRFRSHPLDHVLI
jgi:hypothetical protein